MEPNHIQTHVLRSLPEDPIRIPAQPGPENAAFPSCSWWLSLPLLPRSQPEACRSLYSHSLDEKAQLLIPEPAPRFLDRVTALLSAQPGAGMKQEPDLFGLLLH